MNLIKCENKHFFDNDKFDTCPHCANQIAQINAIDIMGQTQSNIKTLHPEDASEYSTQIKSHHFVVGWLVCTEGKMKGDSFGLHEGVNHIGRAGNMDIALIKEPSVSRNCHAQILYDKDSNQFYLSTDEDHIKTTLWNESSLVAEKQVLLQAHDCITLGDCTLRFIPFCGSQFSWFNKE